MPYYLSFTTGKFTHRKDALNGSVDALDDLLGLFSRTVASYRMIPTLHNHKLAKRSHSASEMLLSIYTS
jgi:hypothetical protein